MGGDDGLITQTGWSSEGGPQRVVLRGWSLPRRTSGGSAGPEVCSGSFYKRGPTAPVQGRSLAQFLTLIGHTGQR